MLVSSRRATHVGQEATLSVLQVAYGDPVTNVEEEEEEEEEEDWRSRLTMEELLETRDEAIKERGRRNSLCAALAVVEIGDASPRGELGAPVLQYIDNGRLLRIVYLCGVSRDVSVSGYAAVHSKHMREILQNTICFTWLCAQPTQVLTG